MKLTKLHLIIILALALILCPVLGVCYNSNSSINTYNYREGYGQVYEEVAVLNEGMSGQSVDRLLTEGFNGWDPRREAFSEGYTEHNPGWGLFSEGFGDGYPYNQVYEGMSGQSVDRLQGEYDVLTEGFNGWEPRWEGFSEGMTTGDVLTEGMSHIPDIALQEGYNRHAR